MSLLLQMFVTVLIVFFACEKELSANQLNVFYHSIWDGASKPDKNLASDPVLGRLVCPPAIQYNLLKKNFSSSVFSKIKSNSKNRTWIFTLSNDARWSSGEKVKPEELVKNIDEYLQRKGQSSKYSIDFKNSSIEVAWQEKISFGPYMLSGLPMFKFRENEYVCTGDFSIKKNRDEQIVLETKSQRYRFKKIKLISSGKSSQIDPWISIGNGFKSNGVASCKRSIDRPIYSAIIWNENGPEIRNASERRALDRMIPRNHLVKYVFGKEARLVSAPLNPSHPGYKKGLSESAAHKHRFFPKERNVLICSDPKSAVLQKFLQESFLSHGVKLTFSKDSKGVTCDGWLVLFKSQWPDYTNLYDFASEKQWPNSWSEVRAPLDKYLKSHSFGEPDFNELQNWQRLINSKRLLSVIVQHNACIHSGNRFKKPLPPLIVRNLDWFRELLY